MFGRVAAIAGAAALILAIPQPASAQSLVDQAAGAASQPAGLAATAQDLGHSDTGRWIVRFAEPSLATYEGGIGSLAATSPQATGEARLDVAAPESAQYLSYLDHQQELGVTRIAAALEREVAVTHQFQNVLNAVTVEADDAEAARIAALPGVNGVYPDRLMPLETDASHDLIGSPAFWDGATGPGVAARGEGITVGMIDTGVNPDHPSFAAVDGEGFTHTNPLGSGNFVGACDPDHPDHQPVCNDKLIGAWNFTPTGQNFPSVEDMDGHGSHTGSTMAGNRHDAPVAGGITVQGVAPRANVISYLVCDILPEDPTRPLCPFASSVAAVDQAIADPTEVLNYSIGGEDDPWTAIVDQAFLDASAAGIFVSASAGNSGPNLGTTANTGPWNATVAASTTQRILGNQLTIAGLDPVGGIPGSGPAVSADITAEIRFDEGNVDGCAPFAAGTFDGAIALISRGACAFAIKVANAADAGATAVVLFNNIGGPPIVAGGLEAAAIPTVMLGQTDGETVRDAILANAPDPTTATLGADIQRFINDDWADVMADFSSAGPSQHNLQSPTVTAPGVNIFAAGAAVGGDPDNYILLQGTSMASPHVAGSGALLMTLHPDWSPAQVQSALAGTADPSVTQQPGATGPANPFNHGSGRIDLDAAARVGLVLDETVQNFQEADPATGGDPRNLNVASLVDQDCAGTCSWTRTVQSVADAPATYAAIPEAADGMGLSVTPETFTIDPGATQEITVTADVTDLPVGEPAFGDVQLLTAGTHAGGAPIASVHLPVNLVPQQQQVEDPSLTLDPTELNASQGEGEVTEQTVTIGNDGDAPLTWELIEGEAGTSDAGIQAVLWDQPNNGTGGIVSGFFNGLGTGTYSADDFVLSGPATIEQIHVEGFANLGGDVGTSTALNWLIYPDDGGTPAGHPEDGQDAHVFALSTPPSGAGVVVADNNITLDLVEALGAGVDLAAGSYWLTVFPDTDLGPGAPDRWNWFQGVPQESQGHLVDPSDLFGVGATDWTPLGPLVGDFTDLAFQLQGTAGAPPCTPADVPWLSHAPANGTVDPGGSQDVTVTFDSTGLEPGEHTGSLCLTTDDPLNQVVEIPVTLTVTEEPGQPGTCDEVITGMHVGQLVVEEGTTCLAAGAVVLGEVVVLADAGLVATAAVIQGPLTALDAAIVDLAFTQVTGPVLVSAATTEVSVLGGQVTGNVALLDNSTGGNPITVTGNVVIGSLVCFGNQPEPTDHGMPNVATAGKVGQCADL